MKRNQNIREAEGNEFVKKEHPSMNKGKKQSLERNPAMKIETTQAQKIFPDSRKTRNCSDQNGNIEQKKTNQGARPNDIPVPGNYCVVHNISPEHSMFGYDIFSSF
jgi:hypothetical protein